MSTAAAGLAAAPAAGGRGGAWDGERAQPRVAAGATCAGCWRCCGPTACAAAAMLVALLRRHRRSLAPPLLAKAAIDQGIEQHDIHTLVLVVVAFLRRRAARVGR